MGCGGSTSKGNDMRISRPDDRLAPPFSAARFSGVSPGDPGMTPTQEYIHRRQNGPDSAMGPFGGGFAPTEETVYIIAIASATGKSGGALLNLLCSEEVRKVSPYTIRALTRDPEGSSVAAIKEKIKLNGGDLKGVEFVGCDMSDDKSVAAALKGVDFAYLATVNTPAQVDIESRFIDYAARACVRRVVRIGLPSYLCHPDYPVHGGYHQRILDHVAKKPKSFRCASHGCVYFMQNIEEYFFASSIVKQGELRHALGELPMRWMDVNDVARITVGLFFCSEEEFETYNRTVIDHGNPDAKGTTMAEVAEMLTEAGHACEAVPISLEEWAKELVQGGMPSEVAECFVGLHSMLDDNHPDGQKFQRKKELVERSETTKPSDETYPSLKELPLYRPGTTLATYIKTQAAPALTRLKGKQTLPSPP
eukprot:Hpha_TRINITY_DN15609_c3_g1::TRINITY_DN15609_c3_g1_i1::g.98725::m.98725